MNFQPNRMSQINSKIVYFVNGMSFENDKGTRNGKQKAIDYCIENMIATSSIIKFDSRLERDRYIYLLELQNSGKIKELNHHFLFRILPPFTNNVGDKNNGVVYESDFTYIEDNKRVVEDVKGSEYFLDERFLTIKSFFDYQNIDNTYLKVIMRKSGLWVEWKQGEPKKSQKLIVKQREELKKLKEEKHIKEVLERKEEREKKRLKELKGKEKLTSSERNRLDVLSLRYGL